MSNLAKNLKKRYEPPKSDMFTTYICCEEPIMSLTHESLLALINRTHCCCGEPVIWWLDVVDQSIPLATPTEPFGEPLPAVLESMISGCHDKYYYLPLL